MTCLCNIASHHGSSAKQWMIQQRVASTVLPFVQNSHEECVKLGLQLISLLLYDQSSGTVSIRANGFNNVPHK